MPFNIGSTAAKKVYWGTTEVKKIFSGTNLVWESEFYDPYMYGSLPSGLITKYDKNTQQLIASNNTGLSFRRNIYSDENYFYATPGSSGGLATIYRFDKNTLSVTSHTYEGAATFFYILALTEDVIYAVQHRNISDTNCRFYKINKSNMSVITTRNYAGSTYGYIVNEQLFPIDFVYNKLFFVLSKGHLASISLDDLTITYGAKNSRFNHHLLDGGDILISLSSDGRVITADKDNLTLIAQFTNSSTLYGYYCWNSFYLDGYLYAMPYGGSYSKHLIKASKSAPDTLISSIDLTSGYATYMIYDKKGCAYVYGPPSTIKVVDVINMTIIKSYDVGFTYLMSLGYDIQK